MNSLETKLERKVVSAFGGIVDTLFKVEDGAGRQEEKSKTIEKKDMQRVCVTEEDVGVEVEEGDLLWLN